MAVQIVAGYWDLDLKSQELLLCPRSRQMLGFDVGSPKKLSKDDWLPRLHPDDIPVVEGEFETAGRRNDIYAARFRAVWPDGSIRHILGVGQATVIDRTRFVGVNLDLVATAASADLESRQPSGMRAAFARSRRLRPTPANENKNQKAHATRINTIYEGLGQRLTAISLAVGAIEAGAEVADSLALIRMAVAEAWQELKLHRHEARQEVPR